MTGDRLRVTVVIPALNEEERLPGTVRSARRAGADEVIVVDGGSADGTVRAGAAEADRCIATHAGRASQMNAGAEAASGEIILFLHADTRLPAGAAAAVREAVHGGAGGGGFAVRLEPSAEATAYRKAVLRLTERMIGARARIFRAYTGDQAIFIRSTLFRELGGYPDIPLMEDVVLSRKLTHHARTVLLPDPVVTSARRWEARGPVRTILLMWALRLAHLFGVSPARCARVYARGDRG